MIPEYRKPNPYQTNHVVTLDGRQKMFTKNQPDITQRLGKKIQ